MRERLFRFKKFSVCHQNSAMKIGVDAVLLGAVGGVVSTLNCGVVQLLELFE